MSRPCSVQVERKDIDMNKLRNAEEVAELLEIEADTVRRWVKEFNEMGYDALRKKKTPSIEDDSHPKKKSN
jgi:transposase